MLIELQRRWTEALEQEEDGSCGLCGRPLDENLSVIAYLRTDEGADAGQACIACVEFLGECNPERFPTIGEFRKLLERYPEAMYPDMESLERAGEEAGYEDPWEVAAEAATVWSLFKLHCGFGEIYTEPEED